MEFPATIYCSTQYSRGIQECTVICLTCRIQWMGVASHPGGARSLLLF